MKKFTKKQKGVSLLEMLIAMGIGLLLIMALAILMTTSNKSSAERTLTEMMDESARQVFAKIGYDITMAGYVDTFVDKERVENSLLGEDKIVARFGKFSDEKLSELSISGANWENANRYSLLGYLSNNKVIPVFGCGTKLNDDGTCPNPNPTTQQSIRLSHEVIRPEIGGATPPPFPSLSSLRQEKDSRSDATGSCNGEALLDNNSASTYSVIANTYFLKKPTNEKDTGLSCYSARWQLKKPTEDAVPEKAPNLAANQNAPAVSNIDQMVFRYLVTSANGENKIEIKNETGAARNTKSYLQPNSVQDANKNPLGWSAVTGVEVCLVVAMEQTSDAAKSSKIIDDLAQVQPIIPSCLRKNNGEESYSEFQDGTARSSGDNKFYRRYVRTFSISNNLNLPMLNMEKIKLP